MASRSPSWRCTSRRTWSVRSGGGPTFLGTLLGQTWVNEWIETAFLAVAGGSILYVIIELLADGDRDAAAGLFLTESAGVPAPGVEQMKASPMWPWFTRLAASLPYDIEVTGPGNVLPADRLATIAVPVLVLNGGNTEPWLAEAARAVAAAVPHAHHSVVDGQDHGVLHQPDALRPALVEFFG